jgi:putative hydrolase of the HAD superfamily
MEQAIPAARYVYVADNEAKDFVAPNARGWLTVKVAREGGEYLRAAAPDGGKAQVEIGSLGELRGVLEP